MVGQAGSSVEVEHSLCGLENFASLPSNVAVVNGNAFANAWEKFVKHIEFGTGDDECIEQRERIALASPFATAKTSPEGAVDLNTTPHMHIEVTS